MALLGLRSREQSTYMVDCSLLVVLYSMKGTGRFDPKRFLSSVERDAA